MSGDREGSRERRVTENDQEFLMRTLTKSQWDVVAKCLRAEVEMEVADLRERLESALANRSEKRAE